MASLSLPWRRLIDRLVSSAAFAFFVTGCFGGGTCVEGAPTSRVVGSITFDDSERGGSTVQTFAGVVILASRDPLCQTSAPCVIVPGNDAGSLFLRWDCPDAAGLHSLAELNAELCEETPSYALDSPAWTCSPVAGTLSVNAVTLPCSDGTCGHLDAELVLADGAPPVSATGSAHLLYDVTDQEVSCGGASIPMFGLD